MTKQTLALLPDETEAEIVILGSLSQSSGRAWGIYSDALGTHPHLAMAPAGQDLTILEIDHLTGSPGLTGSLCVVRVADAMPLNHYTDQGELRLVQADFGDSLYSTLRRGYANVVGKNSTSELVVEWQSDYFQPVAVTIIRLAAGVDDSAIVAPITGLATGSHVRFSGGSLPTGITAGATYVLAVVAGVGKVLDENGDSVILTGDGSGTMEVLKLTHQSGYVHLHDKHKSFDSVWTLQDYIPEQPGDYPEFVGVPGHDLSGATSYRKVGLWLPFTFLEGVEGFGYSGVADSVTSTTLTKAGAGWIPGILEGTPVRCANSIGDVTANTDSVMTLTWRHGTPTGTLNFEVALPHWATNPHAVDAGEGFRYPSNDHQPGGYSSNGTGLVYNRPKGRLNCAPTSTPGGLYTGRTTIVGTVNTTIRTSGVAASTAVNAGDFVASIPSPGVLRIQWGHTANDVATGRIQADKFIRGNYVVSISAWGAIVGAAVTFDGPTDKVLWTGHPMLNGQALSFIGGSLPPEVVAGQIYYVRNKTANDFELSATSGGALHPFGNGSGNVRLNSLDTINGNWRVYQMGPKVTVDGSTVGSYIDLVWLGGVGDPTVPISISGGACESGAAITRLVRGREYRLGWHLDFGIRMAQAYRRRVKLVLLAINSAAQIATNNHHGFAYPARVGWFDPHDGLDWTPSNPNGLFERLREVVEEMVPIAQAADVTARKADGLAKDLIWLANVMFQAEADALSPIGKTIYDDSLAAAIDALRDLMEGRHPYSKPAKFPVVQARLTKDPWSSESDPYGIGAVAGDPEGYCNGAMDRKALLDGFYRAFNTDDSLKLGYSAPGIDPGSIANGGLGSLSALLAGFPSVDPIHFGAPGELRNAGLAADDVQALVELAFSFSLSRDAVSLCNAALNLLGESARVKDLMRGTSVVEQVGREAFPHVRDELLTSHAWTFATRRFTPTELEDVQLTTAYDHTFNTPPDMLVPTGLLTAEATDDEPGVRFDIETDAHGNSLLLTDEEAPVLRYTSLTAPMGAWSALFRKAVVHALAARYAGALVKGSDGAQAVTRYETLARAFLEQAAARDRQGRRKAPQQIRAPWHKYAGGS